MIMGISLKIKNQMSKNNTKEKKTVQPKTAPKKAYVYAIGRRKTANARIRLFRGKGQTLVNDKPIDKYFSGKDKEAIYNRPFIATKTEGKYWATIRVEGSGMQGQLLAVVHGLARALDKENREIHHTSLKGAGLLTRDSRERERRKPGLGGKARRHKQSPKR